MYLFVKTKKELNYDRFVHSDLRIHVIVFFLFDPDSIKY